MKIVIGLICSFAMLTTIGFGTTHTISSVGLTFSPSTITITAGDTVIFALTSIHDAVEVSQATWNANQITRNGGFTVPFGGGSTILTVLGTHYYVCENHGPMGMKGIITVNPAPPPLNTITVENFYDHDGNLATTNDRVLKNWDLKLYKDSIGSGIIIDSVNSGTSFTANNLSPGTYVAWEADSASWSHISVSIDGISQGSTATNQWPLTVTSGETHTIGFINFTPPPPNSLTIENLIDQDGNLSTTGDRLLRNWGLKLYRDSVGSGIVVDSVLSGTSFTVNNLGAGTYVAVEADTASWSHISVNVDGISQGATTTKQWSIILTSGETHFIDFINFSPHTIINSGFTFVPDSINVFTGDTLHFVLEAIHTAREVSETTWVANDTVSNGGFDLPPGGGTVVMSQAGIHYYVCLFHASMGMKGRIFVTTPPPVISITNNLLAGWNMISIPVQVADPRSSVLFPSATSPAFGYQGRYITQSDVSNGIGYWLKFQTNESVSLTGFEVARDTFDVAKGWNMIGSISTSISRSSIISQPSGIIGSSIFGYNGSYFIADSILPGKGYWVKTNQSGKLIFDSTHTGSFPAKTNVDFSEPGNKLTIRDATGKEQTLYIIEQGNGSIPGNTIATEFPPVPPSGGFDIRFSNGQRMIVVDTNSQQQFPIEISSAQYPMTVTWNIQTMNQNIYLQYNDIQTKIRGVGNLIIAKPNESLTIMTSHIEPQPTAYTLYEAFPNPFNPSTTIRYALPVESRVFLRIYNVLGQRVATLKNGVQEPGIQTISWNAQDYVSGVYFIQITAAALNDPRTSFIKVNKIILQK